MERTSRHVTFKIGIAVVVVLAAFMLFILPRIEGEQVAVPTTTQTTDTTVTTPTSPAKTTTTTAPKTTAATKTVTKTTTTSTAKPNTTRVYTPPSSSQTYVDYMNQLSMNDNTCKTLANKQYASLYSYLESGAFTSYFNTRTGVCYFKASGVDHPAHSTGVPRVFFRNASSNSAVAECANYIANTMSDSEWTCTNKITGQSMNYGQFNDLVNRTVSP